MTTASTPPEGAQLSEDGFYWWDDGTSSWQPVARDGASAADDAAPRAGDAGAAAGDAGAVAAGDAAPHDIPYLKLLSSELMTPAVSPRTQGVWARYEVVNIGTAPSDDEHDISWGAGYSGTILAQGTHKLDPPIAANGGSYEGTIHFDMHHLQVEGDWELVIQIDVGMNKGISDSVHLPFTVAHADPEGS